MGRINLGDVCLLCKDKNGDFAKENIINRLTTMLQNVEPTKNSGIHLDWDIHSRCFYNLSCSKLKNNDNSLRNKAERLNEKIITIALSEDPKLFNEVLQLLRGHFSRMYKTMERIHIDEIRKRKE